MVDWARSFGSNLGYAPEWAAGLAEDTYRNMIRNLYSRHFLQPLGPPETTRFTSEVLNPWSAASGQAAVTGPQIEDFARNYWDWLQGGASTYTDVPASDLGPLAANALHYVGGVGYVKEADLEKYDPRGFAAIAKQRTAEATNPAINPYWESTPGGVPASTRWTQNVSRRPAWMQNYSSFNQFMGGQTQSGRSAGAGAGARASAGGGAGVNYSAGTGNRVGNVATTSTPGQTAVTPNQWSGDYEQQARERAAKKMGRDIAQVGVTKVPNMREQYSRRVRQNFRRY